MASSCYWRIRFKAAVGQLTNVSSQGRQEDWEVVRTGLIHTEMEIGTKFYVFLQQILIESPLGRKWQPTPVVLPGKYHGQRNLAGYSLWDHKESETTGRLNNCRPDLACNSEQDGLVPSLPAGAEMGTPSRAGIGQQLG